MYIKQIKLKGFRTYKNETTIDFTKGINCIVGFNGSGKSNILLAIEFILSDMCEYKQVFLHEGIGNAVRSCYVEIIFDNSEKYFSMFKENYVKIKKVLENMKCEIFVNDKNISKNQYVELLESCGLCVNNLYNIIKQGQIIKLSNMKEDEILNYLKNILGAKIFEEKKKDSLSMLKECNLKKDIIEKEFNDMNIKLDNLKIEFDNFIEYKKLEKEKIHLEYFLNEINYKNIYEDTQNLKLKLQDLKNKTQDEDNILLICNNTKSEFNEKLNKMKLEIVLFQNELDNIISDEIQNKRNIIHLQILIDEKKKEKCLKISKHNIKIENVNQINEFISRVNNKLHSLKEVIILKEREIENKNNEINMLLSKNKTKNAKEGNYSHNVKKIEKMISDINSELSFVEKETIKNEKYLKELEEESKLLSKNIKENKSLSEKYLHEINELNSKSERCVEEKRHCQQKISEGTSNLNNIKSQMIEVNDKYEEMIKSSNKEIVKMVEHILEESNINKEHILGFLIDNINVDKTYAKAVDTVLENHYFTLIVEDMQTAKNIVEFIEKKREEKKNKEFNFRDFFFGKLTIVPLLNIKKYGEFTYPSDKNIVPLIKCVNYNSKIYDFLKNILFKTIIVKSLEACQNYLEDDYNCVNIDGDYLSKHGFMYGGYNKKKYGIYTIYNKLKELKEEEKREKKAIEEFSNNIEQIEEELRLIYDKKSTTLAQKNGCVTTLNSITNSIHANEENVRTTNEKIRYLEEKKESLEEYKEKLKIQILQLRNHNVNPDETHIGDADINSLNDQVKKLKEDLNKVRNEYDDFKNKLELLYQKRNENDSNMYMEEYEDIDMDEYEKELNDKKNNIEKASATLLRIYEKTEGKCTCYYTSFCKEMENVKSSIDKILINEKKHKKKILDLCHQMNQINEELRILEGKEENIRKKKILLPQGVKELEEYKNYDKQELSLKLKSITLELKKYSNVNEKAGDRLNMLMGDFNELKKRNEEISTSYENIKEMIQHIGKKKDEALEATYIKINKYFSEYFSLLFKNRKASLVLKRMNEREYKDKLKEMSGKKMKKKMVDDEAYVDKITGISINITSNEDEKMNYAIQELSGGERSIVAICLFLCLNKIDNFSFFFFDEIDAALDTVHRDNLSLLLKELANRGTQFIITTFRKELLEYCENMYIVKIIDRESYITKGTKQEAYEIISIEEKNAIEN
ncbi:structural maintenance of chromosomes protein 3, putative [Plasmodium ovale]|uniref:Structural maintenance of chromosomes protein 3, putative n=1 Tax=Plasmodium ovale TaxID=36330 RepID=A0A1D3KXT0_PLAOA|nr:structural maintenance of chromosomes protein 3, putative [Plasmodium ovale]